MIYFIFMVPAKSALVHLLTLASWMIWLLGCDSDSPDPRDGGLERDGGSELEITPPTPPELTPCPEGWTEVAPATDGEIATCEPWPGSSPVVMTPCPAGWREVEVEGVVSCDPWPEGGPQMCGNGEAHFVGEASCSRIGTACPPSGWADDLPTDQEILFVRAGAPSGGSGARELPFGSIEEATDLADEGTIIALSTGTFDEAVRLSRGVTLWGACTAETVVSCSTPSGHVGTVSIGGRDTVLRNLQISGQRPGVTLVGASSYSVLLEQVLISRVQAFGMVIGSGSAVARNLVVRDTESGIGGLAGRGLEVFDQGRVVLQRAAIVANRETGIYADGLGTTLDLSDLSIRDTRGQQVDNTGGRGLEVEGGALVEVRRSALVGNAELGVGVVAVGSVLSLADVLISDTQTQESDDLWGYGLHAGDGARLEMRRVVFERNGNHGVFIFGVGTTLDGSDLIVRDTQYRRTDGQWGRGLAIQEAAQATVRRAVIERNRDVAVAVRHQHSKLVLVDAIVRDTFGRESDGMFGRGLDLEHGSEVEVVRALFERNHNVGVIAGHEGTKLHLEDVVVRDTLALESDVWGGRGLSVHKGATAEVARALFDRNRVLGVYVAGGGTSLVLTDSLVRDTQPAGDGRYGRGLNVQKGARAAVSRAVFDRNREIGVFAGSGDTALFLEDVAVGRTLAAECEGDDACPGFGDGISSLDGSTCEVTRFAISHNARCGITIVDASMDLRDGEIFDNVLGACIRASEFELERLLQNVRFRDNERRLDPNTELPVPASIDTSEWE